MSSVEVARCWDCGRTFDDLSTAQAHMAEFPEHASWSIPSDWMDTWGPEILWAEDDPSEDPA